MATRRATRKYADLASFFADREEHLSSGYCFLPPGSVRGELAPEVKLDLSIPIVGRVGPLSAQVVQRAPDGSYGLRLVDFAGEAGRALKKLDKAMAEARAYFVSTGELGGGEPGPAAADADELNALRERVRQLERALAGEEGTPTAESAAHAPDSPDTAAASAALVDDDPEPPVAPGDGAPATEASPDAALVDDPTEALEATPPEDTTSEPEPAPAAAKPRGIPIVDVSEMAPTLEGVTEGGGLLGGLLDIASEGLSGMLTLHEDSGLVRYCYFASGGPVAWRSVPLQEREVLGLLLFQAEQVTKEQLQESLERMQSKGIRQGEAFIEMEVMSDAQLSSVLGRQVEYILQQVLRGVSGSWTFHQLDALPEAFLPPPLQVGSLLFRASIARAKNFRGRELADTLRDHVNSYVQLNPERTSLIANLGLKANERKLVAIIAERTLRMRELFSMSPMSRQATAAVFFAFMKLGLFLFGERETHARYVQRVGAAISKKKRQLIQCSHFDVLECHWISLPSELEEGFQKLKDEYDLTKYNDLPDDLAKVVTRISQRIDEAYEVLKDDLRRREYRKTLVEDFMIVQSAELLAKKGEMAVMRKDPRLAALCYAKALELQPRNGAYRTSLQRARAGGG